MDECIEFSGLGGFSTELFPDFQEKSLFEDVPRPDSSAMDSTVRRASECRSDGTMSYDSDDSHIEVDVGEPEHVLKTRLCSAGDDELVSYLTTKENKTSTPKDVIQILKITGSKPTNGLFPRIVKIDPSKNVRTFRVVKTNHDIETHKSVGVVNLSKSVNHPIYKNNNNSLSKSAIAARENREKKKKYVSQLEKNVADLKAENKEVKEQNSKYSDVVDELKNEVLYLKSVLASQSTLSKLLQNIPGIPDITLTSSDETLISDSRKRSMKSTADDDKDLVLRSKIRRSSVKAAEINETKVISVSGSTETPIAGVCLHVSGSAVSLELCSTCNKKAKSTKL